MNIKEYTRTLAVVFKDIFINEPAFEKKYLVQGTGKNQKDGFVFSVDGLLKHGGLFDQYKGMISVYASAKAQNIPFYLNYSYLIKLDKYLQPNSYDWRINNNDICMTQPFTKSIIMFGEYKRPFRLMKRYKGHQVHFYYGYNSVDDVNHKFGTSYSWGNLYHELFRPTDYLQKNIDDFKHTIGGEYIAFHLRFMNLLGDNNERIGNIKILDDERKRNLMTACRDAILKKRKENGHCNILVASDSNVFLNYIASETKVFIVPGQAKHIDNANGMDESDDLKLFMDYYALAGASSVYSIIGENMYSSAFPEYAAKIGDCHFERIYLH